MVDVDHDLIEQVALTHPDDGEEHIFTRIMKRIRDIVVRSGCPAQMSDRHSRTCAEAAWGNPPPPYPSQNLGSERPQRVG